jgi:hypothetical protein
MRLLSTQVTKAFPFGLSATARAAYPRELLPATEAIVAWGLRLRCRAHRALLQYNAAVKAARAAPRGEVRMPSSTEVAELVRDSAMVDCLVGFMPPIRGACLRSLQVCTYAYQYVQ